MTLRRMVLEARLEHSVIGMGSKMSGEENVESLVSRDPMPTPMLLNCIFIQ